MIATTPSSEALIVNLGSTGGAWAKKAGFNPLRYASRAGLESGLRKDIVAGEGDCHNPLQRSVGRGSLSLNMGVGWYELRDRHGRKLPRDGRCVTASVAPIIFGWNQKPAYKYLTPSSAALGGGLRGWVREVLRF